MDNFYIIALGASGGGLKALLDFFKEIPKDIPAAYVVITHIKREHKSRLHQMIGKIAPLPVIKVISPQLVEPGNIYVLSENRFLTITQNILTPRPRRADEIVNHAVDIFFKSLARDAGNRAVGIILSGSGSDGLMGAQAIEKEGGYVMAASPEASQFAGMPQAVIESDSPHVIAQPAELARRLASFISK